MRKMWSGSILIASLCIAAGCAGQPAQTTSISTGQGASIAIPAEQNTKVTGENAQAALPAQPPAAQPQAQEGRVVADARVVPIDSVGVSFKQTNVTVSEILVKEGDQVKAGDPLARLDSRELELQVRDAQAGVAEAKASYEKLTQAPSDLRQKQQQLEIDRAKAQLSQTKGSVTKTDVDAAQGKLDEAKAALKLLMDGAKAEDIAAARAGVEAERARLEDRKHDESAQKTNAQGEVLQAANSLRDRQAEYSAIKWDNLKKGADITQADIDTEARALHAVQNAEVTLDQAKVELERTKQSEIDGIRLAESDLAAAQAKLDKLLRPPTADLVAAAKAEIKQRQADLEKLQGENRSGRLGEAQINTALAEGQEALLLAPANPADVTSAQAQIERAQVELDRAQLAVEKATIRAPRAGTIASINLKVGEMPSESSTIVVADLSQWQIVTNNLSELNVGTIREGDPVDISFYAIPDLKLTGKVVQVRAIGASDVKTDTTYAVMIAPDTIDKRMRWNMSASVSINPVLDTVAGQKPGTAQTTASSGQPK